MLSYVTDTQAMVKYLLGQKVINQRIHDIFKQTEIGQAKIIVPAVVLFEIAYLHEKGRIPISLQQVRSYFLLTDFIVEEPLSAEVISHAFAITDIPELHDRLIAGHARFAGVPVLTNDPLILASQFVATVT